MQCSLNDTGLTTAAAINLHALVYRMYRLLLHRRLRADGTAVSGGERDHRYIGSVQPGSADLDR